jgi:hypothetical protein
MGAFQFQLTLAAKEKAQLVHCPKTLFSKQNNQDKM